MLPSSSLIFTDEFLGQLTLETLLTDVQLVVEESETVELLFLQIYQDFFFNRENAEVAIYLFIISTKREPLIQALPYDNFY